MIYIDSDGVLSDFDRWIREDTDCKDPLDPACVQPTMYKYYKDCFLTAKVIKRNKWIWDRIIYNENRHEDYRILTSLPNKKACEEWCTSEGYSKEEFESMYETFRRNKLEWFAQRNVPAEKVIITEARKEKMSYCKNGDLLLDDHPATVREWREAGGRAYLVINPISSVQIKENKDKYLSASFISKIVTAQAAGIKHVLYSTMSGKENNHIGLPFYSCCALQAMAHSDMLLNDIRYDKYHAKFYYAREGHLQPARTLTGVNSSLAEYMHKVMPDSFCERIAPPGTAKVFDCKKQMQDCFDITVHREV